MINIFDFDQIDFKVPSAKDIGFYSDLYKKYLVINCFGRLLALKYNSNKPEVAIIISITELDEQIKTHINNINVLEILNTYFKPKGWKIHSPQTRGNTSYIFSEYGRE